MSIYWWMIWDAVQSSRPAPTADSPGVIPSFLLAWVCCFSLNALSRINTHRITNVINSQQDLTTAEKGQCREARERHNKSNKKSEWTVRFGDDDSCRKEGQQNRG